MSTVAYGGVLLLGACAAALALGRPLPALLRRLGAGKTVRSDGPASHQVKSGTPSMAGLLFGGVTLVLGAVFVAPRYPSVWVLLGLVAATGALGFVDDLYSSARFKRGGLRARVKLVWLLGIAGVAVALAQVFFGAHTVRLPFAGLVDLGPFFLPLGVLVIVATANAVNLTDGLDGLAGGTAAIAFLAYAGIALMHGADGVALCLLTTVGALLGFLSYNVHPARFFMGDTGSLALGALLGGAALLSGDVLVLPVVGAVFVAVALSVILQVAYFKRSGGKRLFRMAPLHHHFELIGWPETQIVGRFWIAGAIAAAAGVALALT